MGQPNPWTTLDYTANGGRSRVTRPHTAQSRSPWGSKEAESREQPTEYHPPGTTPLFIRPKVVRAFRLLYSGPNTPDKRSVSIRNDPGPQSNAWLFVPIRVSYRKWLEVGSAVKEAKKNRKQRQRTEYFEDGLSTGDVDGRRRTVPASAAEAIDGVPTASPPRDRRFWNHNSISYIDQ